MGRRFEPGGTPIGSEFTVSTSGTQDVTVASDDSGNFVVAWSRFEAASSFDVMARLFDSSGTALGDEFVVNSYTAGEQQARGVARRAVTEQFVVTWAGFGTGGAGIWARVIDVDGNPNTGDVRVNEGDIPSGLPLSAVAMNGAGGFVVAWEGESFSPFEGYQTIFARRFDASGQPLSPDIPVPNLVAADRRDPQLASDHAGNFIVTWTASDGDGSEDAIEARLYDRFATVASIPFVVIQITTGDQYGAHVALNDSGRFVVAWSTPDGSDYGVVARRSGVQAAGEIAADVPVGSGPVSVEENGVIEPGETANIATGWVHETALPIAINGTAQGFSGPAGADYIRLDSSAEYYDFVSGTVGSCLATGNCYVVSVSAPAVRPVQHWDAILQEHLNVGLPHTWVLHIGESFPDVPAGHQFYAFIENLFHNGVTGGCAGGGYCPTNPVTRAQMAVFLLKSKFGSAHVPPPCTGTVFPDVPCTGGPFDPWIEELASLQITGGCGGGLYCPNNTVTRQQMAVFLLKALEGSTYVPPACTGVFDDVACPSQFGDWIEELADRQITGGCSVSPPLYCPTNPNNRGQMAVFLTKTFGLALYGP